MSYYLIIYSPWEGLRVAITGTKGRIEMEIAENINHLQGDGKANASASKGPFKSARIRAYPMFGTPYDVETPVTEGAMEGLILFCWSNYSRLTHPLIRYIGPHRI